MNPGELLLAIVAGAGGLGAMIWVGVKAVAKYVVEDLNRRYQYELDKKLEAYKQELEADKAKRDSILSNKVYITKAKFDVEFKVYRALSERFFTMVRDCSFLFTAENYYYDGKRPKEFWVDKSIRAIRATDQAQSTLFQNAPFVSESLYDAYQAILLKCQEIIQMLEPLAHGAFQGWTPEEQAGFLRRARAAAEQVNEDYSRLCGELRAYLARLDIL